jgi:hypothetical protein
MIWPRAKSGVMAVIGLVRRWACAGGADGGGSVIDDDPSPPAAVDPVDSESFDPAGDLEDGGLIEG